MTTLPVTSPSGNLNTAHANLDVISPTEINSIEALLFNASIDNSSVAANIAAATLIAAANVLAGEYVVEGSSSITTAGTTGALTLNVIYTDKDTGASNTQQVCSISNISSTAPQYANGVVAIQVKAGVVIQYSVSGITTPGSLAGAIHLKIKQSY